jgi:hypothetical protein
LLKLNTDPVVVSNAQTYSKILSTAGDKNDSVIAVVTVIIMEDSEDAIPRHFNIL